MAGNCETLLALLDGARRIQERLANSNSHLCSFRSLETKPNKLAATAAAVAAANQPRRSAQANRWTHFGARLRPLTSATSAATNNHHHQHEAAASSSSKATAALAGAARHQQTVLMSPLNQLNGNQLTDGASSSSSSSRAPPAASDDEAEMDEDDLDNEALLYKLMQQQSFLMNPNFQLDQQQQQQQVAANSDNSPAAIEQANQARRGNGRQQAGANQLDEDEANLAKSKRVIKLLKSYSHIHQVDDSDDQIRGAYARYPQQQQQRAAAANQRGPSR